MFTSIIVRCRQHALLAHLGTFLCGVVAVPLLTIGFNFWLGADAGAIRPAQIAAKTLLLTVGLSVAAGISAGAVQDRNLGIFLYVHSYRGFALRYWGALALVNLLVACLIAAVCFIAWWALGLNPALLWQTLQLLPQALGAGVALGVFSAGLASFTKDPFLGDNLVTMLAPLASGVFVPLHVYPPVAQQLCWLSPFTPVLLQLDPNGFVAGRWLVLLVGGVWLGLGVFLNRLAIRLHRRGLRADV